MKDVISHLVKANLLWYQANGTLNWHSDIVEREVGEEYGGELEVEVRKYCGELDAVFVDVNITKIVINYWQKTCLMETLQCSASYPEI